MMDWKQLGRAYAVQAANEQDDLPAAWARGQLERAAEFPDRLRHRFLELLSAARWGAALVGATAEDEQAFSKHAESEAIGHLVEGFVGRLRQIAAGDGDACLSEMVLSRVPIRRAALKEELAVIHPSNVDGVVKEMLAAGTLSLLGSDDPEQDLLDRAVPEGGN